MNPDRSLTLAMLVGRWVCDAYVALDTDVDGDIASAIDRHTLASLACRELGAAGLFAVALPAAVDELAGAILARTGAVSFDAPDLSDRYAALVGLEMA